MLQKKEFGNDCAGIARRHDNEMSYQGEPIPNGANNGRSWRCSKDYDSVFNSGRIAIRHKTGFRRSDMLSLERALPSLIFMDGKYMKIPFEVPVEWASAGIESCAKIVIKGKVKEGVVVKEKINGNWKDNNYFNCGCNRLAYTPTYNEVGAVSQKHMDGLVRWFESHKDYSLLKAKVLRNGTKYNFTLVVEQRCLNFHMVVCK